MSFKSIKNAAKAVIIENDKLLVMRKENERGVYYVLPGGGQEPGESLHQAVVRECMEELGLEVEPGYLIYVRDYISTHHNFNSSKKDVHKVDFFFLAKILSTDRSFRGAVPDKDQTGLEWISLKEIEQYPFFPRALALKLKNLNLNFHTDLYLGDVN